MATHTRVSKENGTTSWANGDVLTHTSLNAEFDQLINDYNGNINNDNIATTAGKLIDPEKVDDHAVSDSEFLGVGTDPGNHFSPNLPLSLADELESLRYRIRRNNNFADLNAMSNAGSLTSLGWLEPGAIGPNLLYNPGFEVQTLGAGEAPDGWTKAGSPTTLAIEAASELDMGSSKRSLNIIASTTGNEGITTVVKGLKADTKYVIGAAYVRTAVTSGAFTVATANGLASGDYKNFTMTDSSSTTLTIRNSILKTDSSGSDVTVSLAVSGAIGAEVNIYQVWMHEIGEAAIFERPAIPVQTVSDTTPITITPTSGTPGWNDTVYSALSLSQYVPGSGYILSYESQLSAILENFTTGSLVAYSIQMQIDAGGWVTVQMFGDAGVQYTVADSVIRFHSYVNLKHVVPNPVPGSNYQFRTVIHNLIVVSLPSYNFVLNSGSAGPSALISSSTLECRRV